MTRKVHHIRLAFFSAVALAGSAGCNTTFLSDKPEAPVAVIQGAISYSPLDRAPFDGSASHAQDGSTIVSWDWVIESRPAGSTTQPEPLPGDPAHMEFTVDLAGDYVLSLTVTDDRGLAGTTEFPFSAVPWQKMHVSLVWSTQETDMDLHLVSETEGGAFFTEPFDCFFQNTNPDWGVAGDTSDDPSIDVDDVDGRGPENASLNQPLNGHRYRVFVHYYDDRGLGASTATVRIYLSGVLRFEGIRALAGTGAGWEVATIEWPSGGVAEVGTTFVY